jgi:hypothetical protein
MTQADRVLRHATRKTRLSIRRGADSLVLPPSQASPAAGSLFDDLNRDLYDFAVGRLSEMLDDLKVSYFAEEFRFSEPRQPPLQNP